LQLVSYLKKDRLGSSCSPPFKNELPARKKVGEAHSNQVPATLKSTQFLSDRSRAYLPRFFEMFWRLLLREISLTPHMHMQRNAQKRDKKREETRGFFVICCSAVSRTKQNRTQKKATRRAKNKSRGWSGHPPPAGRRAPGINRVKTPHQNRRITTGYSFWVGFCAES
jgi:hypothetical protein